MKSFIFITCMLHTAFAAPQLISFKDGKVGVNFLGYHAQAGLGGGQNGANGGLLGGLHASAGTPWGQNAAAGLGGSVNGRSAGILYAGAQATPDVGASAVLGGDTSQGGFSGSEAYANGKVSSRTRTIVAGNSVKRQESADPQYPTQPITENVNVIQKIRPPKKYHSSEPQENPTAAAAASIVLTKTITKTKLAAPLHTAAKDNNEPSLKALTGQSLDINEQNYNLHNHFVSSPASSLPTSPLIIPSSISLSQSSNGDNLNENVAEVINDDNQTSLVTARGRVKVRNHASRKQRRNHHQKRINANRQRQKSKTIVTVVEQKQEPQQELHQLNSFTEEKFPIETQQHSHHPQQRPSRRQLIASPPAPYDLPAPPCDSTKHECKNVRREVRSDAVQNALQIPIGILQSLQQSLGNLGAH